MFPNTTCESVRKPFRLLIEKTSIRRFFFMIALCEMFHSDNIFTICIMIIEIRRKKNPVLKNSFDTPPLMI